ncbi:type II secretion system secretin GspD [Chromobacterium violaceum]|uniref:type II secretion system secretin GspD n=1 Tax=Chromobacterium violaceum TaxID=536 RepID=UPI0009D92DE9|nr:type II secretion system secretin GspD [Chromobacterium violaceum]OQS50223.1 type II secretion system protein GspD [Chromobacterium violaceum]OQS52574.1 type II secretion system protein GspD [Chromobacterium violaceum]QRO32639.1 type II secretion system secretin GspD [Chromobacterium violaceum]QRQ17560.1 type II secretion system secretin GspD [Chromobacterium violaceum]
MRISKLVVALSLIYSCNLLAAPQNDTVMLNFVNADIETVVKAIGEISGKNFIIDPRVKGTVNIVSSRPVPRALSYQVLLSSLRLQGFSAVEGNGVIKIVPEADAKLHAKASKRIPRGDGDRLITKVFALRNSNANQLVPVIRPLVSPNNTVAAYPQANALIVTDYADNIQRIESIIESVESAAAGDTVVIPVLFGSAVELANSLNKLMQEGGADGGKTTILADARANVLLVRADTPGKIGKVKSLLKVLDQPSQAGSNVRVVYLKNAQASEVAKTLRLLLASEGSPVQTRSTINTVTSTGGSASLMPSTTGSGSGASAQNPVSSPDAGAAAAASSSSAPSGAGVGTMIQADSNSNALILNVPDPMYQNLRNVIDLLDKRRAQVYVEALVMEVTASRATKIGVQWAANVHGNGLIGNSLPSPSKPLVPGGSGVPDASGTALGSLIGSLTGGGLTAAIINTITVGGQQIPTLGLLAQALEQEAQGNLVASPQLVTMDNEKAKIVIGQEIGVPTATYPAGTNGTSNAPYSTYDRKTVGFGLEITPQISEGGTIRMKISQAADSIDQTTLSAAAGPTFNRRTLDTVVTVGDGGLVALGGLTQEATSNAEDKVPLLGDIPLIGNLFKYQGKERKKTNLMIFIRPTIIRDEIGNRAVAGERYGYVMEDAARNVGSKLPLGVNDQLKTPAAGSIHGALNALDTLNKSEDNTKAKQ